MLFFQLTLGSAYKRIFTAIDHSFVLFLAFELPSLRPVCYLLIQAGRRSLAERMRL